MLLAQQDPAWDNTSSNSWGAPFKKVEIKSRIDGKLQQAYFYPTKSNQKKPLIVSLHTWSGDYSQKDPLIKEILARDWNYIHPDFRGKNNHPEAVGSDLVIADIEDAIEFALTHSNSSRQEVHIIGVSGGGHATLCAFMNVAYPVKSFSAWVPISDIQAWYWESVGRGQRYARDILLATSQGQHLNTDEAKLRSPLFQHFPKETRKDSRLYIYTGIHDGYTGSVPITHSLNMYNRLVADLKYNVRDLDSIHTYFGHDHDLVTTRDIVSLLAKRTSIENGEPERLLYDRKIHYFKKYHHIELTVFEGGHEQIPQALSLIPYKAETTLRYNILTIGDSNGQSKNGWVEQLKKNMPQSTIVNISQGGRTIGFDSITGKESYNTLKNIDNYLAQAESKLAKGKYDYIIICLGTNDTKEYFDSIQDRVVDHYNALLKKVKSHKINHKGTKLIFVSPPPVRKSNIAKKYEGANERLEKLLPEMKENAKSHGFIFIDIFNPLQKVLDYYAKDGVHMSSAGQDIIAGKILDHLMLN